VDVEDAGGGSTSLYAFPYWVVLASQACSEVSVVKDVNEEFRQGMESRLERVVDALRDHIRAGIDPEDDSYGFAILRLEELCAYLAYWFSRVPVSKEALERHRSLTSSVFWEGTTVRQPDFCTVSGVVQGIVKRFKPHSDDDKLVRALVVAALQCLWNRKCVELWPEATAPEAYRATVACAAAYPDLPPMPVSDCEDADSKEDADAKPAEDAPASALPGSDRLNAQERAVVDLLAASPRQFFPAHSIQSMHGTRSAARASIRRMREKCPTLPIESARDAWTTHKDTTARDAKGYRGHPPDP